MFGKAEPLTPRLSAVKGKKMIRDLAKAMLEMLGHEVVLAMHGEEAIKLFKKHSYSGETSVVSILLAPGNDRTISFTETCEKE